MVEKVSISVNPGGWQRIDHPVDIEIDLAQTGFGDSYFKVIEEDEQGNTIDKNVPFQWDVNEGVLTLIMSGRTPSDSVRYYALVTAEDAPYIAPLVALTVGVEYQGQESYKIETPAATYLYHKIGAGFASIFDPDGYDWLSYRPFGGSDGKYRGIPNLAYPENYFHPGGTGCRSEIISNGPLKVKIGSESKDGEWSCHWEIYPSFARLTVLKVGHPYWFLYEGTPGGELNEEDDYCVLSDGTRLPLTERWALPLPTPEWIYFGASKTERALYLVHHEADQHVDSFWPMEHNMTVFGFGRNNLESYMVETPSQFTIGFAEDGMYPAAQRTIDSAFRPILTKKK